MLAPLGKRIFISELEEPAKGALILSHKKPKLFSVSAIGDEVTKVKAGDVIYLDQCYGIEVEHKGDKFLVIEESQILAKLD